MASANHRSAPRIATCVRDVRRASAQAQAPSLRNVHAQSPARARPSRESRGLGTEASRGCTSTPKDEDKISGRRLAPLMPERNIVGASRRKRRDYHSAQSPRKADTGPGQPQVLCRTSRPAVTAVFGFIDGWYNPPSPAFSARLPLPQQLRATNGSSHLLSKAHLSMETGQLQFPSHVAGATCFLLFRRSRIPQYSSSILFLMSSVTGFISEAHPAKTVTADWPRCSRSLPDTPNHPVSCSARSPVLLGSRWGSRSYSRRP